MEVNLGDGRVRTSWYSKPTDMGLILSFPSVSPTKYRNVIEGTILTVYNATSDWQAFNSGLVERKITWVKNQYPPAFYKPIVKSALNKTNNAFDTPEKRGNKNKLELCTDYATSQEKRSSVQH